jgi:DNA-binding MarR family transcriptional regulator
MPRATRPPRPRRNSNRPGPGRLDSYLFYWIGQIDNLYKRAILDAMRPLRINVAWWRTLAVLNERGPVTVGDLARITVIERTALTHVLHQMEKRNLVRRKERVGDRRVVEIHLQPEGEALFRRILPEARAVYERATAGLQRAQIVSLIAKLKEIRKRLPAP